MQCSSVAIVCILNNWVMVRGQLCQVTDACGRLLLKHERVVQLSATLAFPVLSNIPTASIIIQQPHANHEPMLFYNIEVILSIFSLSIPIESLQTCIMASLCQQRGSVRL